MAKVKLWLRCDLGDMIGLCKSASFVVVLWQVVEDSIRVSNVFGSGRMEAYA